MVSRNAGMTYSEEAEADDPEELLRKGLKLDEEMLRWCINAPDGQQDFRYICAIHKNMLFGHYQTQSFEEEE